VAIDFFLIACTETIRKSLSGFFAKRGAEHTGSRWLNHPRLPPRSGIFIRESFRAHLQMPPLTAPKHPGRSSINRRHSPWWLRPDVQTQTAVESDPNCSGRAFAAVFGRIPFTCGTGWCQARHWPQTCPAPRTCEQHSSRWHFSIHPFRGATTERGVYLEWAPTCGLLKGVPPEGTSETNPWEAD